MTDKSFSALFAEAREQHSYWAEKLKGDFAEDLYTLMERRGYTKKTLAQRIGSSPAYLTKVLRGDSNFTIESMVKLVFALDGQLRIDVSGQEDEFRWNPVIVGQKSFDNFQRISVRAIDGESRQEAA